MMAVNLNHQMLFVSWKSPRMDTSRTHASIVNMSSTAWMNLAGNLTAYHTAKAGIVGLTRGLARDLGPASITVNFIAPGRVMTDRVAAQVDADRKAETRALQCIPGLISTRGIAEAALWQGSSAAQMVTGQTLVVDGGVVYSAAGP